MKPKPRVKPSKTHEQLMEAWMSDPEFKTAYDALEEEFQLLREMLQARQRAGLTQAQVAESMGTKAPAIARLEAFTLRDKSSPSIQTLRKYAKAVGCHLDIHLKPFIKETTHEKHG